MRESDIKHENGSFWVGKIQSTYTVYRGGPTVSTPDSSYPMTPDGLSIAVARCNYLAKNAKRKLSDDLEAAVNAVMA